MGDAEEIRPSSEIDVAALYREHIDGVVRLLRSGFQYRVRGELRFARVQSTFDLEDVCHEAFKAFLDQCQKGNFDRDRPAGPYIRRIAVNIALRRIGKASREDLVEVVETQSDPVEQPDPEVEEARRLVSEFKAGLPELDQRIIEGCMVDGLSQSKVGRQLGLSRDQVYRSLQKSRAAARAFFAKRGWFDDT